MICFLVVGDFGVYNVSQIPEAVYSTIPDEESVKLSETFPNKKRLAKSMAKVMGSQKCKFVVNTGDSVYPSGLLPSEQNGSGRLDQVMGDFPISLLQKDWVSTLGNHDCQGDIEALYNYGKFRNPRWLLKNEPGYFSKIFQGATNGQHIFRLKVIVLNACMLVCPMLDEEVDDPRCSELPDYNRVVKSVADEQWRWILKEVETSDADKIIVVGHWPIFSIRGNGPTILLHKKLRPILLKNRRVIAYLSGHDHSLQHFVEGQLHYLISGAGGSSLHPFLKKSAASITTGRQPELKFVKDGFGFMLVSISRSGQLTVLPFDEYGQRT